MEEFKIQPLITLRELDGWCWCWCWHWCWFEASIDLADARGGGESAEKPFVISVAPSYVSPSPSCCISFPGHFDFYFCLCICVFVYLYFLPSSLYSWDANSTNTNTINNTNTSTITNTDEQSWNIDISIRSSSWCSRQSMIAGMQILRTGRVQTWYWSTPSLLQMITLSLSRWSELLCHTSDDQSFTHLMIRAWYWSTFAGWSLIGRCLIYQMITLCLSVLSTLFWSMWTKSILFWSLWTKPNVTPS